jgi:looped-hinge helix DNA binding domain, AbrB family
MKNAIQTTIDSDGRLIIPQSVRDEAGILPGMALEITVQDGRIELEPLRSEENRPWMRFAGAIESGDPELVPRKLRTLQKGPLRIAVPANEGPTLKESIVQQVLRDIRE